MYQNYIRIIGLLNLLPYKGKYNSVLKDNKVVVTFAAGNERLIHNSFIYSSTIGLHLSVHLWM